MPAPPPPTPALDVFISYAREDRPTAAQLAAALQKRGMSVWWDREILGGAEFSEVIERELNRAGVVVVLWSEQAVRSSFVRDESARALAAGKLLPVRIEDVAPPLGFGQIQTLDLIDWEGEDDAPALAEVAAHVQRHLKGDAVPLPVRRWRRGLPIKRRSLLAAAVVVAVTALGWFAWNEWFARDAERARELTLQGVEKFEARLFDPARLLFNQALEADDRYAPAFFYRAQVLIQGGAPQEAADDLRLALELKRGLDGGQLRDAGRWLADLAAGASDPAPVTRVAVAAPVEAPAAAPPPPPAARAPAAEAPSAGITERSPERRPEAEKVPPRAGAGTPSAEGAASPATAPVESRPERGVPLGLPPSGAALDRLSAAVEQMFSPSKDARMAATTGLIVDASATSDATPIAVRRGLQALGDGMDPRQKAGIINVLTLLQAATPGTLAQHATDVRRLLDGAKRNGPQTAELVASVADALERAEKLAPLVYLQIAVEGQRSLADTLAARLRDRGYRVPAAEVVAQRAPARSEIRVQGRSDQGLARWMAKAMREVTGAPVTVATLRNAKPKVDTFEIWLDGALCVAADRKPPACAG